MKKTNLIGVIIFGVILGSHSAFAEGMEGSEEILRIEMIDDSVRALEPAVESVSIDLTLASDTREADHCIVQSGVASYYGTRADGFAGRRTASGARMIPSEMTAAMREPIPLNSTAVVSYQGRAHTVLVNDRGPFVKGRIIDLSPAAARALGIDGVARVTVKVCGVVLVSRSAAHS